jgi:hypothetical protein
MVNLVMSKNEQNNIESVTRLLQKISLQQGEKRADRKRLGSYIDTTKQSRWTSIIQLAQSAFVRTAFAAAAVVFAVGGLTYTAQDSLPGSPLYVVKTNINEPFTSFMAWSNLREAETESTLAARRISELQELLNSNNITASTSADLLSRISNHTRLARQEIAELEMSSDKKDQQADELRSRLQALLAVQGQEMQKFLQSATASTTTESRIAKQAGEKLTELALTTTDEKTTTTMKVDNLSASAQAVLGLLQVTVRQMETSYGAYLQHNNPNETPPPSGLVSAAYDLESGVVHIETKEYSSAVADLEAALDNLKHHASSRSHITMEATTTEVATNTDNNEWASSSQEAANSQRQPVGLPTRQALHNQTIKDAIAAGQAQLHKYSFDTTDQNKNSTSTEATTPPSSTSSATITEKANQNRSTTTQKDGLNTATSSSASSSDTNDESAM